MLTYPFIGVPSPYAIEHDEFGLPLPSRPEFDQFGLPIDYSSYARIPVSAPPVYTPPVWPQAQSTPADFYAPPNLDGIGGVDQANEPGMNDQLSATSYAIAQAIFGLAVPGAGPIMALGKAFGTPQNTAAMAAIGAAAAAEDEAANSTASNPGSISNAANMGQEDEDEDGPGDDPKVICSELHRQGLMAPDIYAADEEFGRAMRRDNPDVMSGYLLWAEPIVRLMRRSPTATRIVSWLARPWSEAMAYDMGVRESDNFVGRRMMRVGISACRLIGRRRNFRCYA